MKKFFAIILGAGFLVCSLTLGVFAAPSSPSTIPGAANSAAEFNDYGVSCFTDSNFEGSKVVLTAGQYTRSDLAAVGIANDSISSIKIPGGYIVKVYQNDNFSGSSATLTADTKNLEDYGLNNAISSLQISIFQ